MGAIYCETCLAARMQGGAAAVVAAPAVPGAPSPGLATFLGFIPGVGAMYNGQFSKAIMHVLIFGGLTAISDHAGSADGLFGMLGAFFYFYMVFDAYKTAKARQMGEPLPDMLGLNNAFGQQGDAAASSGTFASLPIGATILIGLGGLFLMANFGIFDRLYFLHLGKLWPVVLIALGLWIIFRNTGAQRNS